MSKKYTAKDLKDNFTITIQFSNEGNSRTDMTLTKNDGDGPDIVNMRLHGINLAENSTQLDDNDHAGLQAFCRSYLESCGYNVR